MSQTKIKLNHNDFFDLVRDVAVQIKNKFGEYRTLRLFPIDVTCSYALLSELPTIGIVFVDSLDNADIAIGRDENDTVEFLVMTVEKDLNVEIFAIQDDVSIDASFPWDYEE
jgi:hypothetical protein